MPPKTCKRTTLVFSKPSTGAGMFSPNRRRRLTSSTGCYRTSGRGKPVIVRVYRHTLSGITRSFNTLAMKAKPRGPNAPPLAKYRGTQPRSHNRIFCTSMAPEAMLAMVTKKNSSSWESESRRQRERCPLAIKRATFRQRKTWKVNRRTTRVSCTRYLWAAVSNRKR